MRIDIDERHWYVFGDTRERLNLIVLPEVHHKDDKNCITPHKNPFTTADLSDGGRQLTLDTDPVPFGIAVKYCRGFDTAIRGLSKDTLEDLECLAKKFDMKYVIEGLKKVKEEHSTKRKK
jgi:hypothetical protein